MGSSEKRVFAQRHIGRTVGGKHFIAPRLGSAISIDLCCILASKLCEVGCEAFFTV